MKLFINFFCDEDVSVLVAELLRARGFTVVTAHQVERLGVDDVAQFAYAAAHQYTLLTHNRADFEDLSMRYFETGQQHYGLIIARRHPPYELAQRVLRILDHVTADEMINKVRYI
ncbi:DUF5615 family PIN-like protein [Candidatus Viridilinea mediisalina]|uniref:DUF5615 domain-containing protein n=1 Tax=Candidatus Viridilinea mediisalina TaxID=2024553 RepID=A0A2A6RHC3_9CHLR|nr:DUF5615 family PIN-like protein [Candidatus Viridilinea mediisalina]PDW02296.1 hypothetical protein CJ255_14805 [Candidatus Viridilinea mediisalina]